MADTDPVDEGLTEERTDLAWNRSGLAFAVCVAVLVRRLWPLHGTDQFVALGCLSAGAVAWGLSLTLGRALWSRAAAPRRHLSPRRAAAICAGTLALALAALVLTFVAPA